jgi:hypothetical protein
MLPASYVNTWYVAIAGVIRIGRRLPSEWVYAPDAMGSDRSSELLDY